MPDFKPVMKDYKKLTPFKFQILQSFPFIAEDFDSLTNYELLCKVVEYLNDVIKNEKNVEENVTNLYNSFVELQDYVNNYFDNLDVQEEINNKLDEMVEDGTLQEIIADYLNSKAVFGFDTVESMKNATNLINGSYSKTLGYYKTNDGGGATYRITNSKSETEHQEELNNGLYATLIYDSNKINILQLGVKRNVDEDQSSIVNEILSQPMKNVIYFPSGKYYFENGLVNENRHDIIGDINTVTDFDRNINGTRFYFTNIEDNEILLDCSAGSRCSIRDVYIICNNVEITLDKSLMSDGTEPVDIFTKTKIKDNVVGIKIGNYGNQLINVSIYGCNTGILGATYNVFENIGIICCETGIVLTNDNVITTAQIQRCETGIEISGALNNLSQIRLDSIRFYGIEINSNSNNLNNIIADICQYASIKLNGAQNNYITGSIGRSGTYYANFAPSSEIDASKACKIYLRNNCHNNNINIIAYKSNALDSSNPPILAIPTYVIVTGLANDSNCSNNNITITGQIFDSSISTNTLLTIEQLDRIYHRYLGYISGNVKFEGIEYLITQTNNLSQYNVYVTKPIRYDMSPAVLNSSSNLDMQGHKVTGVNELLFGNSNDGWISLAKNSTSGDLKIQNVNTSYQRSNAEIRGVATPTGNDSATNKNYVDSL